MTDNSFSKTFEREFPKYLEEWKALLRIPSISNSTEFSSECDRCAEWLRNHLLTEVKFPHVEVLATTGRPLVYAEYFVSASAKTVLIYGHYDVQPAPTEWTPGLENWQSNPFEPEIRDGRLFARGAEDNKGQLMYVLKALQTCLRNKTLNCNVKMFIEGEEESQSRGFNELLPAITEKSKGDILLVCDTDTPEEGTGGITLGLRGIVAFEIWVGELSGELHSGKYGGASPNSALQLARLLATLHNSDGSIAVEGFMEGVPQISEKTQSYLDETGISNDEIFEHTGAEPTGGEAGFTAAARIAFRPTIEINGISSGYLGEGVKTIIPRSALAKVTTRLVGQQDPEKCLAAVKTHLQKYAPAGLRTEVRNAEIGGPALQLAFESDLVSLATKAVREGTGKAPRMLWNGGSIPVISAFAKISGAQPLLLGFGLPDDKIHQANESFSLEQFRLGFLTVCELLSSI